MSMGEFQQEGKGRRRRGDACVQMKDFSFVGWHAGTLGCSLRWAFPCAKPPCPIGGSVPVRRWQRLLDEFPLALAVWRSMPESARRGWGGLWAYPPHSIRSSGRTQAWKNQNPYQPQLPLFWHWHLPSHRGQRAEGRGQSVLRGGLYGVGMLNLPISTQQSQDGKGASRLVRTCCALYDCLNSRIRK